MIRAAIRYAEEKGPPPPELTQVLQWRTWGVLPNAGGTRDQRAGDLNRMLFAANVYDVWKMHKEGGLKKMTPVQVKALRGLKDFMNGQQ